MDFDRYEEPREDGPLAWKVSRRQFLKAVGGMMIGAAAVGAGGLAYAIQIEPGWIDLVPIELTLPSLDPAFAGFRLVQLSDMHLSEAFTAEHVEEAFRLALECKPDLIALTGDYIHLRRGLRKSIRALTPLLRSLSDQVQTLAVVGNHDYFVDVNETRKMLYEAGVQELRNQSVSLRRGDAQFHIVGLDDAWDGRPRLEEALGEVPEDGAAVLLVHEPDYADVSSRTGRFDLQISGHSHGGQVVLPLVGPPIRPYLARKYPLGLYQVDRMYQYTNRGLGMTRPFVRFNCRPEITLFTFQSGLG